MLEFLAEIQADKQGMEAKDEFYKELEEMEDADMGGTNNMQDIDDLAGLDDDALHNLMQD